MILNMIRIFKNNFHFEIARTGINIKIKLFFREILFEIFAINLLESVSFEF